LRNQEGAESLNLIEKIPVDAGVSQEYAAFSGHGTEMNLRQILEFPI
jgi:hypothetical protein